MSVDVQYRISASAHGGWFGLDAELAETLPGMKGDSARRLMPTAHHSNAIRGNIDVRVGLV